MTMLSPFQEKCGEELRKVLRDLGHEARNWEVVKGREETYIEADIDPIKIWIYEDGACWQGLGRDRVFETVDYASLEHLQRAFLTEVAAALTQENERGAKPSIL
jgi:hypothetical protein